MTIGIWLGISAELSIVLQHATVAWAASPAQVGLLLATGSVVGMAGGPVGGWLADLHGRRAVLLPAMGVASAATVGLVAAPSLPVFFGAFSLWAGALSVPTALDPT